MYFLNEFFISKLDCFTSPRVPFSPGLPYIPLQGYAHLVPQKEPFFKATQKSWPKRPDRWLICYIWDQLNYFYFRSITKCFHKESFGLCWYILLTKIAAVTPATTVGTGTFKDIIITLGYYNSTELLIDTQDMYINAHYNFYNYYNI